MTDESLLQPFFRRLAARDEITSEERAALIARCGPERAYAPGDDMIVEGQRARHSTLLVTGVACRYELVNSGSRQIASLHLAGDFVDLHSLLLKEMDHSVGALSTCRVVTFAHSDLADLTEKHPHLTRVLWLMTLLDGAIMRQWLVGMGRRSATQRLAHLVCELHRRLEVVGLSQPHSIDVPLTQAQLGDVLGMSTVHANRVLQDLRGRGLLRWEGSTITVPDWERLEELADFNSRYLHLSREPR
jgi:CRP-like cAMP-binding protein